MIKFMKNILLLSIGGIIVFVLIENGFVLVIYSDNILFLFDSVLYNYNVIIKDIFSFDSFNI